MKSYSSINSQNQGKLLKRLKLPTRGKQQILQVAQKSTTHYSIFSTGARKIEFNESIRNKNK